MSWFKKSNEVIRVEFVNNATQEQIAVSDVTVDQLPDSFQLETKLEIGDEQWWVVEASPREKKDFSETGSLKVFLSKIESLDPANIAFLLPTINNSLFEAAGGTDENVFLIHEDDWRQSEFISKAFAANIETEIDSINEIYRAHRVGSGFDRVHLRELIDEPLVREDIGLDAFRRSVEIGHIFNGFGLRGSTAKNSFAFELTDESILFGQVDDHDRIRFLCTNRTKDFGKPILDVVREHNLLFVDWCSTEIIGD